MLQAIGGGEGRLAAVSCHLRHRRRAVSRIIDTLSPNHQSDGL